LLLLVLVNVRAEPGSQLTSSTQRFGRREAAVWVQESECRQLLSWSRAGIIIITSSFACRSHFVVTFSFSLTSVRASIISITIVHRQRAPVAGPLVARVSSNLFLFHFFLISFVPFSSIHVLHDPWERTKEETRCQDLELRKNDEK
jgi:hypothetical protein